MTTSGWTIKVPIGPHPIEVAQYSTDIQRGGRHIKGPVLPLMCSIYAPTNIQPAGGVTDVRLRARLSWGDSGTAEQRVDFDLKSCRLCVLASSARLQFYTTRRLLSTIATAAPTLTLTQACTVVMGEGAIVSSSGLLWTGYTNNVAASVALGQIPAWAKSIGLWQQPPGGSPTIFAAPHGAGVYIWNTFGAGLDDTIHIPHDECWRKFAPLGPHALNNGGACSYSGPATPASMVVPVFELEV